MQYTLKVKGRAALPRSKRLRAYATNVVTYRSTATAAPQQPSSSEDFSAEMLEMIRALWQRNSFDYISTLNIDTEGLASQRITTDSITIGDIPLRPQNATTLRLEGSLLASGGVTIYSDLRLKDSIETLSNRGLLNPCSFVMNNRQQLGFIAQEVQELYPELVSKAGDFLALNYPQLTAVLAAQINQLYRRIEELERYVYEKNQERETE